jgi:hypothetical protein|nr:MAG TPA: hypothetical protein [Caudoviricetes sp.]
MYPQDIPSNLYKPQTINVVHHHPSRLTRFLVDLLLLASIAFSVYWFPWSKMYDEMTYEEFLLQGSGVVSGENVVSVQDRGVGGDCDFRKMGKPDHLKKCYGKRA